jgi:thioredoxin-like negative regulator of GroEL
MNSAFDANKSRPLFSWWKVFIFALLIVGFLILLFPERLFVNALIQDSQPSDVTINYLKNQIKKEPNNIALKLSLARQQMLMGRINEAKEIILPYLTRTPRTDFEWKALWLDYELTRIETYQLKETDPARLSREDELKKLIHLLMTSPNLGAEEEANLAEQALALDLPMEANQLYDRAISRKIKKPAAFFAKAATVALFTKKYQDAARFYLQAMQQSKRLKSKRRYYMKAIQSLIESGDSKKAMQLALVSIDGLKDDETTLLFLVELAFQAGEGQVAENYVNQLLHIKYQDLKE